MARRSGGTVVPDAYGGREQAFIKHRLLKAYLEKLFFIVGMSARKGGSVELCYVDCFAGPWGDDSEGLQSTSIAISLTTLNTCRQHLGSRGISARIRALYVEKDPRSFTRLQAFLRSSTPTGITADCLAGDFTDRRADILSWAGSSAFAFFFIDPTGWKDVAVPILQPLLQRPRSEFLINFMYNDVNRMVSMADYEDERAELLGDSIHLAGLDPDQREQRILKAYRDGLKLEVDKATTRGPMYRPRAAYVRVLDPDKERPKYHLVYLTTHPRGIVEFMEISEQVDLIQKQVRAAKKDTKKQHVTGTVDMFGAASFVDPTDGHASPEDVDAFWLEHLHAGPRRIDYAAFADIVESTDWFPGDFQASLVRLIKADRIANLSADASRRSRRPLHYEQKTGEQLDLVRSVSAARKPQ